MSPPTGFFFRDSFGYFGSLVFLYEFEDRSVNFCKIKVTLILAGIVLILKDQLGEYCHLDNPPARGQTLDSLTTLNSEVRSPPGARLATVRQGL